MKPSCADEVWLIGHHLVALHEVGLHAQAVRSWPDPELRADEMIEVAARYRHARYLLTCAVFSVLGPIAAEIEELIRLEAGEMNPQRMTAVQEGFAAALQKTIGIVRYMGQGGEVTDAAVADHELLSAIATLNAVADHAIAEISSPRRSGEAMGTMMAPGSRVGAALNPADDAAMAAYVQQMAQAGAFSPSAGGMGTRAGAAIVPSQVPYEDRGRTDPTVQAGANALEGLGDMPPIPGVSPAVTQWIPVAIWAIQKAGELIAKLRNKGG